MATLWDRVKALEGKTLSTVSGRGTFDVVHVDATSVCVVPHSSGTPRRIRRWGFERAEQAGLATPGVIPSELRRAGVSEFSPAYVAAVIRTALR